MKRKIQRLKRCKQKKRLYLKAFIIGPLTFSAENEYLHLNSNITTLYVVKIISYVSVNVNIFFIAYASSYFILKKSVKGAFVVPLTVCWYLDLFLFFTIVI